MLYNTNGEWYWFVQWYKISHLVKDWHSIQLGFTSLNRTSIFHLMRNLVPLHDQPFAICMLYRVAHKKNGTVDTVDFSGPCSDQQLSFFTLLDRISFPHYNNTKIIKFWWELFISWVISYGLSFSGFARFPEFRGTINYKLMANPVNDSP